MAQAIAMTALVASLVLLLGRREGLSAPARILWPLTGLWLMACFQLVPLPRPLLTGIAPGPAAVWYPSVGVAAGVLGPGPHPISLHPAATARWLVFATGLVSLTLLAVPALRERRAVVRAAVATVAGGFLVTVYGLVARLVFGDKLYGFLSVPTIAPFGPFVSKNHFAGYVEMAACLAVGLAAGLADEARRGPGRLSWLDSPRAVRVVLAWGAAAVLVFAVPVSLSRGGVVSLAAGLLAFLVVRTGTRRGTEGSPRAIAVAAAGVVLAGTAIAFVLPPEARSRVGTLAATTTGGPDPLRLAVWRDSLRLAASSPVLGSGFGALEDALPRLKTAVGDHRVEHAESDYVELLAEGGLAAGALVGLLIASVLSGGLHGVRDEPHRAARGLRAGALAGVTALLVHSAFDFNLRIPSNALLFALLIAMLLGPRPQSGETAGGAPARRPWLRASLPLLLMTALALVLGLTNPWVPRRFDATALSRAAVSPETALRRRSLEADVVEHLRRRPADASAWVALAWLRAAASPAEAAALASWAVHLDPEHAALRRAAERATGAQIQPRRP
jgi:hypothetical protein